MSDTFNNDSSDENEYYSQICDVIYYKEPESIEEELDLLYESYIKEQEEFEDYDKKVKNLPFYEIIKFLSNISFYHKLDELNIEENMILCDVEYIDKMINKMRYKLSKSKGEKVMIEHVLQHFDMLADEIKEKGNVTQNIYNKYNKFINEINDIIRKLNLDDNEYDDLKNNIEELKIGKNKEDEKINNNDIDNIDDIINHVNLSNNLTSNIGNMLQTKINIFKNKFKNNKLKKDLCFKINGKEYKFSSVKTYEENVDVIKKERKIYPKSNYFDRYKKITEEDIKNYENIIKNNTNNIKSYWTKYNIDKANFKNKLNDVLEEVNIKKNSNINYNVKNKSLKNIYEDILLNIDEIGKDYKNFKIIETYYNRLKENENITDIFKNSKYEINKLLNKYKETKINEYSLLEEFGKLIINNKLSKEEVNQINSINQNSRPARLIKQSKRIYFLREFIDIKDIALSGISNWLRDTSDDNFELLLTFFNIEKETNEDIPDLEYFSDDEPPKTKRIIKLVFT
jgi:hypothetical protein